jgi:hypothetical protein
MLAAHCHGVSPALLLALTCVQQVQQMQQTQAVQLVPRPRHCDACGVVGTPHLQQIVQCNRLQ